MLAPQRVEELLDRIARVRIGIFGDGCLDVYWQADMRYSELSRETPHFPLPIVEERFSPGAAANVAANAAALGAQTSLCTMVGCDWRAALLREALTSCKINVDYVLSSDQWITPAYCKPIRKGHAHVQYEDPRLDFENRAPLSEPDQTRVLDVLAGLARNSDILAVSDQLTYGVVDAPARGALRQLGGKMPIVADSRARIAVFDGMIIKPNELEALAALSNPPLQAGMDDWQEAARQLSQSRRQPVIVTLGEQGALWAQDGQVTHISCRPAQGPVDIVGAGDAFLSAFCCAYAAGAQGPEAVAFAHLAAGIVVKKIGTTGTASPGELLSAAKEARI